MKFFVATLFAALAVSVKADDSKCDAAIAADANASAARTAALQACTATDATNKKYFTNCETLPNTTGAEKAAMKECEDGAVGMCVMETQPNFIAFFSSDAAQTAGCCAEGSGYMAMCSNDEMLCLSNMMADPKVKPALESAMTECDKADKKTKYYSECTKLPSTTDAEKKAKEACEDKADTVCYTAQSTVIVDFFKTDKAKPCCNVEKFVSACPKADTGDSDDSSSAHAVAVSAVVALGAALMM